MQTRKRRRAVANGAGRLTSTATDDRMQTLEGGLHVTGASGAAPRSINRPGCVHLGGFEAGAKRT